MLKKFTLLVLLTFVSSMIFASFPVNKANVEKITAQLETKVISELESEKVEAPNITVEADNALSPAAAPTSGENMLILLLLWFFLGGLAGHRWYAKKPTGWNILFILTLGGLGIWWLVDGIRILSGNFMD